MNSFRSYLFMTIITFSSASLTYAQESKRDVDQNVFVLVEATIKDGQYDKFVEVAKYMSDVVFKEEPTALTYQWTVSNDHKNCRILERYTSSETTMGHMALFNEKFAERFFDVVDVTSIQLYGNPSNDLLEALGVEGYYGTMAGFSR